MASFSGTIQDIFVVQRHVVLFLNTVEGLPQVGMSVLLGGHTHEITELCKNSTDGLSVSSRSCLTGQPVAPYGALVTTWTGTVDERRALVGTRIQEVQN